MTIPEYLKGYEALVAESPRQAACAWLRDAKYGLFLHYGLYSLVGERDADVAAGAEWAQYNRKMPVAEYAKLAERFTAENFDAEKIASFAKAAGMGYVTLTTRHHDSFCLFETKETDFNVMNTPCGRDLVGELADACARHGLGLCLYYSHGRDWRHPHAANNDAWGGWARPEYDPPEPTYAAGDEHDLNLYLEFMKRQITELLSNYGPIAAIWLDGVLVPLTGPTEQFKCQELYDHIHSLQPQVLVSYKQGVTGTEDFFAPEHGVPTGEEDDARTHGKLKANPNAPIEVCTTMVPHCWGYAANMAGKHLTQEQVWQELRSAARQGYNLLLNSGPLPDGSIDPEDEQVLRAVGQRLKREGFPNAASQQKYDRII